MEKDERQSGGPEQEAGNREPQRASRPAPGKVTRTSRLSSGRGPAVQRKAAAPDAGAEAPPARSAWDHTMDPSMDAAHRGVTALVERGQEPVQQSAMHVMRRASSSAAPSADAAQALAAADGRSGSAPDAAIREKVEATTGADLSSVRVHTGGASQKAAAAVQAKAYTVGSDIHFAAGQYNPTSPAGGELLAHELVHTVQQSGGQGAAQLKSVSVSQPGDAAEREADRIAHAAVSGPSERMAPTERAAPVARAPETLNGNPNELTDNTGANRTTHRSPTLSDSVNAPTATPAASETRAANVKIVAEEASPLHLEPPATPVSSLVYEEADAAQSPAPSGFTTISGFNGTVAAPQVVQEATKSLYINGTPTADDVQQSGIGDCFYLASLMSIVSRDPGKITSMIAPDGNGGGTVTFWRAQGHTPSFWERLTNTAPARDWIQVAVTVSDQLAFRIADNRVHGAQLRCATTPKSADYWAKLSGSNLEVHRKDLFDCARWAPLIEKAYARFAQAHDNYGGARPGGKTRASGYDAINGGWSHKAMCVFYGPNADASESDLKQESINWAPGGNSVTANAAVMEQLALLQGRGSAATATDRNAPIVTATAMVDPLIARLAAALPVAQADPDWANVDATRQGLVTNVATAITAWQALPPDPAPPAPQPKATAKSAIGNACVQAVLPGIDESAGEQRLLDRFGRFVPGPILFGRNSDVVPATDATNLGGLNSNLKFYNHPQVAIQIHGHASKDGNEADNLSLSQRRADNVEAALLAGGAIAPHTSAKTAHGEAGATADPSWQKVDVQIAASGHRTNTLLDQARSAQIRGAVDLMLDLRNIGTDNSNGQRNIYGDHVYSVVSVNIVTTSGDNVPLNSVPPMFRSLLYPMVDADVSTVVLRNPHHGNEPDRLDNNTPTHAGDGAPSDSSSDGTFTMTLNEFFRNYTSVESGVFPRS